MNTIVVSNHTQGVVMKGYLKTSEVAKRFDVDSRTIIRWVKSGHFPGTKKLNPLAKNSPFLIPEKVVVDFEKKQTQIIPSSEAESEDND